MSRAQFWDLIQKHINKQKRNNQSQLHKMGINLNLSRQQLAFGVTFPRFLRGLFYKLVQDDIIYEAEDIIYWNTKYQTSLGKDEVGFEKYK
ncbi:class I tRNA ligase family protein [Patescibacteria group bacterium]|nr:class I tRNA ligase family protein [Patescibacteria group bacterium]MBU1757941.1 class I tRNA ligase family protein [Patescibacteria group bacterium]